MLSINTINQRLASFITQHLRLVFMGIIDMLRGQDNGKDLVDPRVRICVECGSLNIETHGKYIACKECKTIRHFKVKPSIFHEGEFVRILEEGIDPEIVYRIKKIKKTNQGTVLYVLQTESSRKEVLHYEGKDTKLQRVIRSSMSKRKKE